MNNSFHYAFKVKDIGSTRKFYKEILNCEEGRSTEHWIDFNFFGNQISAHVSQVDNELDYCGKVDGISVPIPHFGCILTAAQFEVVRQKFEAANIEFVVRPQKRYQGDSSEQLTMFVLDFSGNPLEFKSFTDEKNVYCKE